MNGCRRGGFERRAPLSGVRLKSQKARNVMTFAPFFVYRFPRKCFASLFTSLFVQKARPPQLLSAARGKVRHVSEKRIRFRPPVNDRLFRFFKKAIRSRSGAEIAPLGIEYGQSRPTAAFLRFDGRSLAYAAPSRAFPPDRPGRPLRRAPVADTMLTPKGAICETHFFPPAQTHKGRGVVRSAARP